MRWKNGLTMAFFMGLFFANIQAFAARNEGTVVGKRPISFTGVTGDNRGKFFAENSDSCNLFWMDLNTPVGENLFKVALAAALANRPVSRIDFKRAENGECLVTLIEI